MWEEESADAVAREEWSQERPEVGSNDGQEESRPKMDEVEERKRQAAGSEEDVTESGKVDGWVREA